MHFLLERQKFDLFDKVLSHARHVMDKYELDSVQQIASEFRAAIEGTEGRILPEDGGSRPDTTLSGMSANR